MVTDQAGERRAERAEAPAGEVRELRLALVCYGGVSLAIYMHGITKEIQKLVVASTAFERDEDHNPFGPNQTERVYWDLLAGLRRGDGDRPVGPRLRVVVDIVSGTSAGGINGVCLAKALACNRSQDALRDLWLTKGDIRKLVRGPSWLPAALRFGLFAGPSLMRLWGAKPPLRGDQMCQWLHGAFAEMDAAPPVLDGLDSLVPRDQALQLFVPVTDFHGYERAIPLEDPRFVTDRTHRHVLAFRHPAGGPSQLSDRFNHGLAFAARATSSFPGAFPPISFASYDRALGGGTGLADVSDELFPLYRLSGVRADQAYFVDGGVLDNAPFGLTIEAIRTRRAASQVDRRLVFVEPDPSQDAGGLPPGEEPGWVATIWGGYAAIPRREPILDDLLGLAQRNVAVARVRDIIESSFDQISGEVGRIVRGELGPLPQDPTSAQLAEGREQVEERAAEQAGFALAGYMRLRIRDVIDEYANAIAALRGFPADSYHAAFVGSVLRTWATADGLLAKETAPTKEQRDFVRAHDLGYHQRRVRFLIAAINWWYRDCGRPGFPTRTELDEAKRRLYDRLAELQGIVAVAAANPDLVRPVETAFADEEVRAAALERRADMAAFVEGHHAALVSVRDAVAQVIAGQLPPIEARLHEDVLALCRMWSPEVAGALLTRYLGFPFWDILTYPLESLSGVGERDHVEVARMSPHDVSLLPVPGASGKPKLYGVSIAHFGAFFSTEGREGDYLWGRLDAAERLITLLLDSPESPGLTPPDPAACRPAFEAILADEQGLGHVRPLLDELRASVDRLGATD